MTLRNYDNVHGPKRSGVMIGKDVISLANNLDSRAATQDLIAIEIVSHVEAL